MGWKFFNSSGQERAARPASVVNAMARIIANNTQVITASSWAQLTNLGTVQYDTNSMTGTANQIIIQSAGKYALSCSVDNNDYIKTVRIKVNGTIRAASGSGYGIGGSGIAYFYGSPVIDLNVGDVITLEAYNSNTSNSQTVQAGEGTFLQAVKVDGALVSYVEVPKSLVGQELAYVEKNTDTVCTNSDFVTVVSAPSITLDGLTPILIEFFTPQASNPNGQSCLVELFDGDTDLGQIATFGDTYVNNNGLKCERRFIPASGAHTFSVRIKSTGTGTSTVSGGVGGAGVKFPSFLRITRAA